MFLALQNATNEPARRISTADDLAAAFLAGYRENTRKAYAADLRHWGRFLGSLGVPVLDAHRAHVDAYARAAEQAGTAPATLARRLSTLSGFYGYALDEGLVARSPVARVRRPRVSDESPRLGLDREEVRRFLDAAERDPRDHGLACLLALNGLRVSEALGVDVGGLGWERGHRTLRIVRKGQKVAVCPLAPRTAAAIDALVAGREEGPIFATRSGRRMDRQAAWKVVRRLAKAASIDKAVSPHSCRHGFVTNALDAGVPLHRVQDAAGHADPRTTQRYNRARNSLDGHCAYALAVYVA